MSAPDKTRAAREGNRGGQENREPGGRGTGLDDAALARKREVLARAAARTPDRLPAREALAEYGGFEIAMIAGAMLGAGAVVWMTSTDAGRGSRTCWSQTIRIRTICISTRATGRSKM